MVIIIQAVSFTSKILNSVNFELGITGTTDTELYPWSALEADGLPEFHPLTE